MIISMNVLDFFGNYTAPISGISYRMQDSTGTVESIVNTESEKEKLLLDGWKVVKTYEAK